MANACQALFPTSNDDGEQSFNSDFQRNLSPFLKESDKYMRAWTVDNKCCRLVFNPRDVKFSNIAGNTLAVGLGAHKGNLRRDGVCYEDAGICEEMGVVVLDGSTVREFAEDEAAFNKTLDNQFLKLDSNNDGVLSRSELRKAFESLRLLESHFGMEVQNTPDELNALYNSVFDQFDTDRNNKVDLNEFRSEMKKIMLAIADGLGAAPIHLVLEEGSLLQEAADFESAKTH